MKGKGVKSKYKGEGMVVTPKREGKQNQQHRKGLKRERWNRIDLGERICKDKGKGWW